MTPRIIHKILEVTILVKQDTSEPGLVIPHIATVEICSDGSVFTNEYIDDPRRSEWDNKLGYGTYHNWKEFKAMDTLDFHPAQMIEESLREDVISLENWGIT